MPGGSKGPWDATAVLAYVRGKTAKNRTRGEPAAIPAKAPDESADGDKRPGLPDARYRLAKAELEELKVERLRGALVERESVVSLLHQRCAELKRSILTLPRSLAIRLVGKSEEQIQGMLRDELEGALLKFVREQGLHDLLEEGGA